MFPHKEYEDLVNETIKQINTLSKLKGGEYAGDYDRLANFRRNAYALGLDMEQVWAVYAAKHWDAIQQYIKDISSGTNRVRLEGIEGRADDLIVYLILFKAIVSERNKLAKPDTFPVIGKSHPDDVISIVSDQWKKYPNAMDAAARQGNSNEGVWKQLNLNVDGWK
jgi:hypothetical protein